MSFSIRTVVQILNALVKHEYIEIVRRMQGEDPKAVRKASRYASDETKSILYDSDNEHKSKERSS